jgi:putative ubiquitin-RnfH superfamily antitoxin RatB of RatAB toxin-antitoxin module
MPSGIVIKEDFKGLEDLKKTLNTKKTAKIGIFSNKDARDDQLTNVKIGAKHEFGSFSENLPRRSFLKDPMDIKRKEIVKEAKRIINKYAMDGENKILELLGVYGESIVQEAFETGGFGTWKPLSQSTIEAKGSNSILIDTAQLRRSITSKVS